MTDDTDDEAPMDGVTTHQPKTRASPSPERDKRRALEAKQDENFEITSHTPEELARDMVKLRSDLNHDVQRRRDPRDELEREKVRLSDVSQKTNNNAKAIDKIMQVLTREGEHKDSIRMLVIKKRNLNMRKFFDHFVAFQNHYIGNNGVVQISSAGPIWQVEVKGPNFAQGIKDSIMHWTRQQNLEVAVIRGKANIAEQRERICTGSAECISQLFGIPKGKGKGKGNARIVICWPDNRPENVWRIVADSVVVLKGRINLTDMRYDVTISDAAATTNTKTLGQSVRDWELRDRTGYLLPVWIHREPDLSQCDWGRAPRGMNGPQGATLGNLVGAQPGWDSSTWWNSSTRWNSSTWWSSSTWCNSKSSWIGTNNSTRWDHPTCSEGQCKLRCLGRSSTWCDSSTWCNSSTWWNSSTNSNTSKSRWHRLVQLHSFTASWIGTSWRLSSQLTSNATSSAADICQHSSHCCGRTDHHDQCRWFTSARSARLSGFTSCGSCCLLT
jgi:hypothetical protein